MDPALRPKRIEELFHAVADLTDEDARRLLNSACPREQTVRQEVERLRQLDRMASPNFLLPSQTLMAELVASAASSNDEQQSPAEELQCPARVGHFVVLKRLDEGAMGIVYIAYDESLGRRVALKVLRRGPALSEQLALEARALARLAHPNVVQIYEIGEHEGRSFIAMELVEGRSLTAWLVEKPRQVGEILRTFVQAGRGLAAAHDAGLVHRDFKPDNVLVGSDGRVRVVDFGVAALADLVQGAKGAGRSGTPAFMAPEVFLGQGASAASDQFGFSVSLYRALCDVAPFAGEDVATLRESVLEGKPRAPATSVEVPIWMLRILTRGLAREPADRYPTMGELLDAIERRLPSHPELDPTIGRRERRMVASVMVYLGLAALAALGVAHALIHAQPTMLQFVAVPVAAFMLQAAVVLALRRRLLGNQFARKVVLLVWIQIGTLVLHRSYAILSKQPLAEVLPIDLLVLGMEQLIATVLFEPWFAINAVIFLTGAAIAALSPASAATAMLASVTLAYTVAAARIGL